MSAQSPTLSVLPLTMSSGQILSGTPFDADVQIPFEHEKIGMKMFH